MLIEGSLAPDFLAGDKNLTDALKHGPVLLAFFKIACPTCQLAFPFLQRLADGASSPEAPRLIAVSQDDAKATASFAERFGISLPTVLDAAPAYTISNLYGLRNVPTLYLIEPDRKISMAVSGFSKAHLEALGERFGTTVFRSGDQVPAMRPG